VLASSGDIKIKNSKITLKKFINNNTERYSNLKECVTIFINEKRKK
jgi:hypothetical protein